MSTPTEHPEQVDAAEEQHDEEHHHGKGLVHEVEHKLADSWHHLEDLTGGRAHVEPAGDQQESNFEHIVRHENAEHH